MLLTIDVGNTNTVVGLFLGSDFVRMWRFSTQAERTDDELGVLLHALFATHEHPITVSAAILASAGIEAPDDSAAAQVKVYILRVRRKIQEVAPGREYIHNIRGAGYMFERRDPPTAPASTEDD